MVNWSRHSDDERARHYVVIDNIVIYDNGRVDNYDEQQHNDNEYDDHDPGSCADDDFHVEFDYVVHDDGCSHHIDNSAACQHDSCASTSDD